MTAFWKLAVAAILALPVALLADENEDRVEKSIRRGLDFISRGQIESGTFDSGPAKSFAGIPALCGMAFLAAGDTPLSEPNGPTIMRIVDHLLEKAREDGTSASATAKCIRIASRRSFCPRFPGWSTPTARRKSPSSSPKL